ncbi:MAG: segregation/condensation protein A [bacterium]|nr:segregation/condensation protein A [bacterium]
MELHKIAVQGFEGPLNLLLALIEEEKLDINRVSLAQVTNQYLEILRGLTNQSPEAIADFLVVAARLILIKSQRLMPQFEITPEEEKNIISLEEQLRIYQQYRERAKLLQQLWLNKNSLFARESYLGIMVSFYPPPNFTVLNLQELLQNVVRTLPVTEKTKDEALARVISLEQRIDEIKDRIKNVAVTSFREAVSGAKKADVVVSFLALLELVKQQIVSVEQQDSFHDILIHNNNIQNNA